MKIIIETIPHSNQRYDTVGDWYWTIANELVIRVSAIPGRRHYEALIAVHELIEALVCEARGVSAKTVDNFDIDWQPHNELTEPGEDFEAPYYWQHQFACGIERMLARELRVNWSEYEKAIADYGKLE